MRLEHNSHPEFMTCLNSVFQRLHRSEEFEGNGIGLVTAQRVIRRHGGTIQASGTVGKGASFIFELGAGGKSYD